MSGVTEKDRRRLKKVKISLMRNPKFALWSGILMVGKTTIEEHFPTAMTNGRDEVYGLEFIRSLNDKELAFVMLHENMHKAFRHLTTWKKLFKENPALANAACDFVGNLIIVESDPNETYVAMPRKDGKIFGCLDKKYKGMNSKQVFDLLKKEYPPQKCQGQKGECGGDGTGDRGQGDCNGSCGGGLPQGFDEHDWGDAMDMPKEEQEELAKEIDRALRQGQIAAAKVKGNERGYGDRQLEELLEPKIDWREILREFMTSSCNARDSSSWRRPNRRFLAQDIYMPTLIGESIGRVIFAVDTSGSISQHEVTVFLTECVSVCEMVHPAHVDLMYWGSTVREPIEEYEGNDIETIATSTKPKDGGGTSPSCVSEYINKHNMDAECIIILTDGYVGDDWGSEWKSPLLWVITQNAGVEADQGKTIHIEEGDME